MNDFKDLPGDFTYQPSPFGEAALSFRRNDAPNTHGRNEALIRASKSSVDLGSLAVHGAGKSRSTTPPELTGEPDILIVESFEEVEEQ